MDDSHAPNGRSGYYFQRFSPSNRYHPMNSHNWLLRQPESLEQWPTLTVFTMVYGAMALKYWGLPPCVERLRKTHSSDFYSPSVQRRSERQDEERQERLAERQKRRQEPDMLELLDVVSQSMRPRRPSHEAEQARQKREQREREESDRKVQDWLNESMDA
ncbi:hypothetical protein CERSUDRAFT_90070 [Gelatoporia subvermispora B]|uniref:Uncharacterized protein n=1 Tax=Ceriporiopsis subvermispora (strain B) TaxID=914234 RepID=M2PXC3_CERS8|nr:hypothetical protein CERSUDRAFT_90070 [Gelatoporia subvermispora B]